MKILHSAPTITQEDIDAVTDALTSKHLEDGELVEVFEKKIAEFVGRRYAVATSSGFASIHLSLIALGVGEDDEVIMPSYTCPALLNPVLLLRAKPVFADLEANSFNISVRTIQPLITCKTKAIIIPHTFGFPADLSVIEQLGVPVIEDCAQALGAHLNSKKLGSFTDVSVFSFYATKMITSGDGGMLLTDDKKIYESALNHRYYGHKKQHQYISYNYHLTNLNASLGISQLRRIDEFIQKRKLYAAIYDDYFSSYAGLHNDFVQKENSIFFRYLIQVNNRDELRDELRKEGIGTGFGVLEGLHQLRDFNDLRYPHTVQLLNEIISLPVYPSLEVGDVKFIARKILKILKHL